MLWSPFFKGSGENAGEVHQIFLVVRQYTPNDVLWHLWEGIRRKLPDEWCSLDRLLAS